MFPPKNLARKGLKKKDHSKPNSRNTTSLQNVQHIQNMAPTSNIQILWLEILLGVMPDENIFDN